MNDTNPPSFEQVNKPPERVLDTPGMMLRKGRENANITYAAVSEALHLTIHYIKALENDDHGKLPGATFVKGYLRTYARFLKLDVNAVLASYERNQVSVEEEIGRTESLTRIQKRHDQTFRWAVVTAVIIVAGVAAGWWFVGKEQASTAAVTSPGQSSEEPQASATVAAGTFAANEAAVVQAGNQTTAYAPISTSASSETAPSIQVAAVTQDESRATTGIQVATAGVLVAGAEIETIVIDPAVPATPNSADGGDVLSAANISAPSQTAALATSAGSAIDQVAVASTSIPTDSAIQEQSNVALSVTPSANGARQVTLISAGADIVQLYFKGSSWVEIDDGATGRLYNETLSTGDAMTLHGTAPFQVLLGDASQVELTYNSVPINLTSQMRGDKTARFSLGATSSSSANSGSGVDP